MGTRTPWGTADSSEKVAKGVMRYDTPSHGGYHLSASANVLVHEAWRTAKGWYEEDCEWAIVAMTFPTLFSAESLAHAKETAKAYYPDQYTAVTGESVSPSESHVLRYRAAQETFKHAYIGICAFGDWHADVPEGMVGVVATLGGERSGAPEKSFLVTEAEYEGERCALGLIVNMATAKEVPGFGTNTKQVAG